ERKTKMAILGSYLVSSSIRLSSFQRTNKKALRENCSLKTKQTENNQTNFYCLAHMSSFYP
ncbi:hypothetical protein, partial [Neobacillus mesonae]|uniref:hypothetical protein n=1 Tax=Neobacillus mesonae TaxID=1193713 RepID=UPI001F387CBF